MHQLLTFAAVLLMAAPAQSQERGLAELRDRARPLLIFALPGSPQLEEQRRLLRLDIPSLLSRDVVVVLPPELDTVTEGAMKVTRFTHSEDLALRQRFHLTPGQFAVILVGKDGEEKLRSQEPLTTEKLSATIDAMPMRQNEMRQDEVRHR